MICFNTSLITITILVVAICVLPAISDEVEVVRGICNVMLQQFCKFENNMNTDLGKDVQSICKKTEQTTPSLSRAEQSFNKRQKNGLSRATSTTPSLSRATPSFIKRQKRADDWGMGIRRSTPSLSKAEIGFNKRQKNGLSRATSTTPSLSREKQNMALREYLKDILEKDILEKQQRNGGLEMIFGRSSSNPHVGVILENAEDILENLANKYKKYLSDLREQQRNDLNGGLEMMFIKTTKVDDPINKFCMRIINEGNYQNFFPYLLNK